MRRERRKQEKNNGFVIYLGTIIFIVLAIAIAVVMVVTTNKNKEINIQEIGKVQESSDTNVIDENTQSASTEIGKTVEEQTNNMATNDANTVNNTIENNSNDTVSNNTTNNKETTTKTNSDTQNNTVPTNTEETPKEEKVTETKKEINFIKPTEGEIILEYAKDNLVYSKTLDEWITHTAIDIKTEKTSVIKASTDGIIKSIKTDPRYGLTVVIEHDEGYKTVYSNLLTAEFVVEGEAVKQGQTIGTAGTSASFESEEECHLHFELLQNGEYLDPTIYLK